MMKDEGFEILEYGNEGSESMAQHKIPILDRASFLELKRLHDQVQAPGHPYDTSTTLYKTFDERLEVALSERVQPGDIICHPLGPVHARLMVSFPECFHVETGIGYSVVFAPYKVFESYAWWHWQQGKADRAGNNYEWVIPNYYDLDDWEPSEAHGDYLLYFGRVIQNKGIEVVREIARHSGREVLICGEGDPSTWLSPEIPNLKYIPPVTGRARSDLLRKAYCVLMPTLYTEPFGGGGVEAMLCGTPLLASDFGAFSETVVHGFTGYRCKTLGDWLYGVKMAGKLDRKAIAQFSRSKYSLETIAPMYTRVFEQVAEMQNQGWYSHVPFMAIPPSDVLRRP
ncbi:MAG: glycosyltransferase [Candidatus Sericytochromatia bacterium]